MSAYELFFKYSMDMCVMAGYDGYFKHANPAFCAMMGLSEEELLSRPFLEFVHPEDVVNVEGALKNLAAGHPAFLVKVRLLGDGGIPREFQWSAYADMTSGLLVAIARDNSTTYLESHRIKVLMDSSPTAVFLVEKNGAITYCNHLAEKTFGYERNELIGKPIEMLVPSSHRKRHHAYRSAYMEKPLLRPMGLLQNLVGLQKDGTEFPIDVGLNPLWVERGEIIICSVVDVSYKMNYLNTLVEEKAQLHKDNARLAKLADHDALTGLYNRRAFDRILLDDLAAAREAGGIISILLMDIDYFKKFNDEHGHQHGDELLTALGEVFMRNIRREDKVARFGGEEFIAILPGISPAQIASFGERLRLLIEQGEWGKARVTVSMGAATHQFTSKRTGLKRIMKQLIAEADQALYHSKNMGRNRFTHFNEMHNTHG